MPPAETVPDRTTFVRRVLIFLGIAAAFILLAFLAWHVAHVLLIVFAGVLLAALLRGLADLLRMALPMSPTWAFAIVLVGLAALLGLGGWYLSTEVASQFGQLGEQLTSAWQNVRSWLREYRWGRYFLEQSQIENWVPGGGELVSRANTVLFSVLGFVTSVVVILFIGIYLAYNPELYRKGILHLLPFRVRDRGAEVLDTLGNTLRWWLVGQLISMTAVGIITALGLSLIGIPIPLALGVIAFFLEFIPYIGPILSALPALVVAASTGSTWDIIYVALLYVAVQSMESYLIQPLVQKRAVELPPALTLTAQVMMGALFGGLGVLVATPLAAVVLVLVKLLYVQDVLGDSIEVMGEEQSSDGQPPSSGGASRARAGAPT